MRVVPGQRRHASDRGGVAVIVSLLMGGVLIGMSALVVDVGQIFIERQELQSGADAAAVAVAQNCAADLTKCTPFMQKSTARTYANANAKDGRATIAELCGTALAVACAPQNPDRLTSCLGAVPMEPYVQVSTETMTTDGSRLLPGTFARALRGNSGYDGTTVGACARSKVAIPCVSASHATYTHEFDGRAGTARITATDPLCSGQTQKFTLISYTAPTIKFALPQYMHDEETFTIDRNNPTHSFKVDIPQCYTQVDFVFGEGRPSLLTEADAYGDLKVGQTNKSKGVPGKVVNSNGKGGGDGAWYNFDNGGPCKT